MNSPMVSFALIAGMAILLTLIGFRVLAVLRGALRTLICPFCGRDARKLARVLETRHHPDAAFRCDKCKIEMDKTGRPLIDPL